MDPKGDPDMKGWLSKWTNYIKGYQRRWFVLSNGFLSYYRNQAEMAHTCRGNISLHGAIIHTEDSCTFVISNGGTQTFHIRATNEVERQRWVTALELAKAKAIRAMESDDEDDAAYDESAASQKTETDIIKLLAARLEDLQTCSDLVLKYGSTLQRCLSELENLDSASDVSSKIKAINEKATVFRIASTSMINKCSEYLDLAQNQGRKWQKALQHERDQRIYLEEYVEQIATQHLNLEQAAKDHQAPRASMPHSSPSDEDEDNEFYDAQSDNSHSETQQNFILKIPMGHRRTSSAASLGSQVLSFSSPVTSSHHSSISSCVVPLVRSHLQHGRLDSPSAQHKSDSSSTTSSSRKLKRYRPLSTSFIAEHVSRFFSDAPRPRRESATFYRPLIDLKDTEQNRDTCQDRRRDLSCRHKRNFSEELRLDPNMFPRPFQNSAGNANALISSVSHTVVSQGTGIHVADNMGKVKKVHRHLNT